MSFTMKVSKRYNGRKRHSKGRGQSERRHRGKEDQRQFGEQQTSQVVATWCVGIGRSEAVLAGRNGHGD